MDNEIRYYLEQILDAINYKAPDIIPDGEVALEPFVPKYIVTAVKLPTGAIELAVNDSNIASKISYILEAYDTDMKLKTNPEIEMKNIMIV